MSLEQSCLSIDLSAFMSDSNQWMDLENVSIMIQFIERLSKQKASVKITQLASLQCYFCKKQIRKIEYKMEQTIQLNCFCNNHCHKSCLKTEVLKHQEQFSNVEAIVGILNQHYSCERCSDTKILTKQMILSSICQKEINKLVTSYKEAIQEKLMKEQKILEDAEKNKVIDFNCSICFEDLDFNLNGLKLKCGCQFCLDCLKGCLKQQITSNIELQLNQITCPTENCKKQLDYEDIAKILDDERDLISKLEQKSIRTNYEAMRRDNPDSLEQLVVCPGKYIMEKGKADIILINQDKQDKLRQGKENISLTEEQRVVDCEFTFILDRSVQKIRHICSKCKYQFCLNNCDSLHEGYSCSDYQKWKLDQNKDYKKELEAQGYRFCPNQGCCVLTERISGCNRITCSSCQWSYCYVCYFLAKTYQEVYAHMAAVGH